MEVILSCSLIRKVCKCLMHHIYFVAESPACTFMFSLIVIIPTPFSALSLPISMSSYHSFLHCEYLIPSLAILFQWHVQVQTSEQGNGENFLLYLRPE